MSKKKQKTKKQQQPQQKWNSNILRGESKLVSSFLKTGSTNETKNIHEH